MKKLIFPIFLTGLLLSSCVTSKKFAEFEAQIYQELLKIKNSISDMDTVDKEQNVKIADILKTEDELKTDISKNTNQIDLLGDQVAVVMMELSNVQKDMVKLDDRMKIIENYKAEQEFFKKNLDFKTVKLDFSLIDDYVLELNIEDRTTENYDDIVASITKNSKTAYEKARSIFIWLANNISYDIDYVINDADTTFCYRKGMCAGYSKLYEKLCKIAGLDAITIIGTAKSIHHQKGNDIIDAGHAWNAVQIDNEDWILLDVTWGAGYVNDTVFTRKIKSFWFDADPSIFALRHLPNDEKWQLIDTPLTESEFTAYPPLDPSISVMGLNGKEVLEHLRTDEEHGFPYMYSFEGMLKINQIPLTEKLSSDQEYNFSFISPKYYKFAVIQEGSWTYFEGEGEAKTLTYQPAKGSLDIAVDTGEGGAYDFLFLYEVE